MDKKASGSFDRYMDEELGDRGFSSDDDDELALERKKMREFVRSVCDAQSAHAAMSQLAKTILLYRPYSKGKVLELNLI